MNVTVDKGVLLGGDVQVFTTEGRGFTAEEIADRTVNTIMHVGKDAHPLIRDQAQAFKENIRHVLVRSLKQAVISDRTTLANRLREAGHPELIKLLNE